MQIDHFILSLCAAVWWWHVPKRLNVEGLVGCRRCHVTHVNSIRQNGTRAITSTACLSRSGILADSISPGLPQEENIIALTWNLDELSEGPQWK